MAVQRYERRMVKGVVRTDIHKIVYMINVETGKVFRQFSCMEKCAEFIDIDIARCRSLKQYSRAFMYGDTEFVLSSTDYLNTFTTKLI